MEWSATNSRCVCLHDADDSGDLGRIESQLLNVRKNSLQFGQRLTPVKIPPKDVFEEVTYGYVPPALNQFLRTCESLKD